MRSRLSRVTRIALSVILFGVFFTLSTAQGNERFALAPSLEGHGAEALSGYALYQVPDLFGSPKLRLEAWAVAKLSPQSPSLGYAGMVGYRIAPTMDGYLGISSVYEQGRLTNPRLIVGLAFR
jgi:hypothetical protein